MRTKKMTRNELINELHKEQHFIDHLNEFEDGVLLVAAPYEHNKCVEADKMSMEYKILRAFPEYGFPVEGLPKEKYLELARRRCSYLEVKLNILQSKEKQND